MFVALAASTPIEYTTCTTVLPKLVTEVMDGEFDDATKKVTRLFVPIKLPAVDWSRIPFTVTVFEKPPVNAGVMPSKTLLCEPPNDALVILKITLALLSA